MHSSVDREDGLTRREAIQRAALLLGVVISPSILTGSMQAQTAPTETAKRPRYLMLEQFETAAAVAERILPRTDSPGAADVGVPEFIDLMYGEFLTWEEKQRLINGLLGIEGASRVAHGKPFSGLEGRQQDRVLREAFDDPREVEKASYQIIKELTIAGYFSSEPIGRKVLHYDPVPGPYQGCLSTTEVGNIAWTR